MTFRDYKPSDEATLVSMFDDFQDYFVEIDPLQRVRRAPRYGRVFLNKALDKVAEHHGKFILVEADNKIVGFIAGIIKVREGDDLLEGYPSTYGEVIELYVEEKYREQHIGSELMKKIEKYFQEKNCDAVFIEVFAPNTNARSFYAKHGYGERDIFLIKQLNNNSIS